jgi:hypothetical protein
MLVLHFQEYSRVWVVSRGAKLYSSIHRESFALYSQLKSVETVTNALVIAVLLKPRARTTALRPEISTCLGREEEVRKLLVSRFRTWNDKISQEMRLKSISRSKLFTRIDSMSSE